MWNEISRSAAGAYASIDQSGGMVAVATPYDDKLAELNAKLVGTAIGYGKDAGIVRAKAEAGRMLPKEVAADRASFFGGLKGGGAVGGDGDLLRDAASGKVDVATAPAASLPVEMQAMSPEARKTWVAEKNEERAHIAEEINALAKKRNAYKASKSPRDSFDSRVEDAVKIRAR